MSEWWEPYALATLTFLVGVLVGMVAQIEISSRVRVEK